MVNNLNLKIGKNSIETYKLNYNYFLGEPLCLSALVAIKEIIII